MSDSARIHQLPAATEAKSAESGTPQKVFRSLKPGEIGPARMNPVYEERAAANAQIERTLKAWRSANGAAGEASVPKGAGSPLSGAIRTKMEPKLGASLGSVRVHTGAESASAAKGFGARAFTVGEDVHFNSGEFNPGTKEGDKLLAHELTHVVQGQRSGIQRKADDKGGDADGAKGGEKGAEVSDPNEPAEKEADAVAEKVAGDEHGDKKKGGKKDKKDGEDNEDKAEAAEGEGKDKKDEAKEGEESAKAEEKPAAISAKLEGLGTKLYRYPAEAQAYQDEGERLFNEEKKRVVPLVSTAKTPDTIATLLSGLDPVFASNQSLAGTMVGKLNTAMAEAQTAWAAEDAAAALEGKPAQAPKKKEDFITLRLEKLAKQAPDAILSKFNEATPEKIVDVEKVFSGICSANWDICAPEEEASSELLNQIGGCYKAFDAEDIYKKMDPPLKAIWDNRAGGFSKWLEGVKSNEPLPIAPPGKEGDAELKPYVNGSKPADSGTVSGFISTAEALKDSKIQSADKAGVLDLLKLKAERYKSKMILAKMGAAGAEAARSAPPAGAKQPKLGKPSMFYLLAFKENVYDANNRQHGSTGGGEPELQTIDMPAQAFMDERPLVKE